VRSSPDREEKFAITAWAGSPNHDIAFDSSWGLLDDLDILVKRLRSKQVRKGSIDGSGGAGNSNFDSFSEAGWSREISGAADSASTSAPWDETSRDYLTFVKEYREAAILCPSHARALKLLGSALFGVGEYRAAEKALEEAIFLKEDYADAHCDLGSALHAVGEDDRAIQEFQTAIDLKPGHVDALYNLGGLNMDAGRFVRAAEMYTRVLSIRPNHWRAQLNKAVALLGQGESEEAKKALKEAFKMTQRVKVYDAISHLKTLQKKKPKPSKGKNDGQGEQTYVIVEASKFKRVGRKTTLRQDLANALDIRAFERMTKLGHCDVELLRKEMNETDVPVSYSGTGIPEKSIRKAALEVILRRLLSFLKPDTFQGAIKAINERILSVLMLLVLVVLIWVCSSPSLLQSVQALWIGASVSSLMHFFGVIHGILRDVQ
jgi:tetratricopeptide (TPR) repeat protein